MQDILGWLLITFGGVLYIAQVISSFNFSLAQRIGIQESPDNSDPILQRSEHYTAYWDLITLLWLPIAGILMVINHNYWPVVSIIGAAIYIDTAGREAAKNLSFKHEGIKTGTKQEQRLFFASYIVMALIAIATFIYSMPQLLSSFSH